MDGTQAGNIELMEHRWVHVTSVIIRPDIEGIPSQFMGSNVLKVGSEVDHPNDAARHCGPHTRHLSPSLAHRVDMGVRMLTPRYLRG